MSNYCCISEICKASRKERRKTGSQEGRKGGREGRREERRKGEKDEGRPRNGAQEHDAFQNNFLTVSLKAPLNLHC